MKESDPRPALRAAKVENLTKKMKKKIKCYLQYTMVVRHLELGWGRSIRSRFWCSSDKWVSQDHNVSFATCTGHSHAVSLYVVDVMALFSLSNQSSKIQAVLKQYVFVLRNEDVFYGTPNERDGTMNGDTKVSYEKWSSKDHHLPIQKNPQILSETALKAFGNAADINARRTFHSFRPFLGVQIAFRKRLPQACKDDISSQPAANAVTWKETNKNFFSSPKEARLRKARGATAITFPALPASSWLELDLGTPNVLSRSEEKMMTYCLRSRYDATLVGFGTSTACDPIQKSKTLGIQTKGLRPLISAMEFS